LSVKRDTSPAQRIRQDRLPTMWCAGCGNGAVMSAFVGAVDRAGLDWNRICTVSGIGCSGRIGGYLRTDSIHVVHGRALPVALGAKLARPDLTVVAFMGDGDAYSIGGNHLLHALRRNDDVKAIVINNMTFGMTGGQPSPTTPLSALGGVERPSHGRGMFDGPTLSAIMGASYVARWTAADFTQLRNSIERALRSSGFCLVEALSQCPVQFGKRVVREPAEIVKWIKDATIGIDEAASRGTTHGRMLVGEFAVPGEGLNPKLLGLIKG